MTAIMEWFNTNSGALQALAAFVSLFVIGILTNSSKNITNEQKKISEAIYKRDNDISEQTTKKLSILVQYKIIDMEDAIRTFINHDQTWKILKFDHDIGVSKELLLRHFDVKLFKQLTVLWYEFDDFKDNSFSEGLGTNFIGVIVEDDAKTKANRILDKISLIKPKLDEIECLNVID